MSRSYLTFQLDIWLLRVGSQQIYLELLVSTYARLQSGGRRRPWRHARLLTHETCPGEKLKTVFYISCYLEMLVRGFWGGEYYDNSHF